MALAVKQSSLLALALAAAAACSNAAEEPAALGSISSRIVQGAPSPEAHDATVLVRDIGHGTCTGSLIADNLVLTARHCVSTATPAGDGCAAFDPPRSPDSFGIFHGRAAAGKAAPDAFGRRITVPATPDVCSFDIALIELDRPIAGARVAEVSFRPPPLRAPLTVVGYGTTERDDDPIERRQRRTLLLGVGPGAVSTEGGPYELAPGDLATVVGPCHGDSGGPLLDEAGRIVGVVSRAGLPNDDALSPSDNCLQNLPIYAGVAFNEAVIRDAAALAGRPLEVHDTEVALLDVTTKSREGPSQSGASPDASSCSATTKAARASWAPPLALALLALALRRRSRLRASSRA